MCELLDGMPHLFRISGGLTVLSAIAVVLYPHVLHSKAVWLNGLLMVLVHALPSTLLLGYGVRFLDEQLDSALFAGRRRFTLDLDPLQALASALRWGGSLLCGPILFAFVAARHWLRCGDPTWLDGLILLELGTIGATWWAMSAMVLAKRPDLLCVSSARALNAAWMMGPRALLCGLMLALVAGLHAWLAVAATKQMHSGPSGFLLLWLVWFSGWCCTAHLLRITGSWYRDSRRRSMKSAPILGSTHVSSLATAQ